MTKKIPSWLPIFAAGALLHPLLRSLWLVVVEGVNWSTQTWIIVCVVAFAWGLVAATIAWIAIPVQIKMTLDRFMFSLAARMDTFEGSMSSRVIELHGILANQLESQKAIQVAEEERSLSTISMMLAPYMIATEALEPGQCYICKEYIANWADRPQGHPDLYRARAHGKLEDGTPCPAPFMFYLANRLAKAPTPVESSDKLASF